MTDLERFLHDQDLRAPLLIRIAISLARRGDDYLLAQLAGQAVMVTA